ncbi:unnamed protein product [Rotaria magnacalcarata]|uniref:Uncharacterized protein n=1 Tax=Rotaria magnacalcarata TaxID=392030 RepID=A0A820IK11_9BILA|nr:unnamed protein product [Rotaria magnacalcarata]CAF4311448.1 unnamed protein product [Rotaria magnacalcarata]
MPGKRDTIVVNDDGNKTTYQKRILLYTIREAYVLFLTEHAGISLGRTVFAELCPKHVVVTSSMAHRVCVCIYYENVNLLLNILCKHINESQCSNLHSFTSVLVWDESNYDLMSSNCFMCSNYFDLYVKSNVTDKNVQIRWYQWKHINGYATKKEQQSSVEQSNASCGNDNYSFSLVSDNISHDKYCINSCITSVINKMKEELPSLEEILLFSDGTASQFKQRYLFHNLTRISNNFKLCLSWHFFATSHAKGVVDAIGGTVKRLVWQ